MVVGAAILLTEWADVTMTGDWQSLSSIPLSLSLVQLVEVLLISMLI